MVSVDFMAATVTQAMEHGVPPMAITKAITTDIMDTIITTDQEVMPTIRQEEVTTATLMP